MKSQNWLIGGLLCLTAVFYFWHLGRPDIVTDESSYATRAIGLVDFDFGIEQPTPWQWIDTQPPWWMRLSFHDHPPLVFLLQHYSMKLFGETPFAVRLPSALAGIAAVIFVYLIGAQLSGIYGSPTSIGGKLLKSGFHSYSPTVGAISALLFAVTANHVWISRIGLQESVLIAFMLASFWAFLRGLDTTPSFATTKRNSSWWLPLSGALLGFAFLAKYLAAILAPILLTLYLLQIKYLNTVQYLSIGRWGRRFPAKHVLLSVMAFLVIASPVIIYNIQLYRHFGHFDFQFSLLFRQDVPEWQARPGQEVLGSLSDRVRMYVPRLIEANSPYFLILSVTGLVAIFWELIRRRTLATSHSPLAIVFIWLLPFLVFIGPAHRFLALLTPWLAIAAGYAISATIYSNIPRNLGMKSPAIVFAAFAAFVAFEAFYAYNSVIALDPVGEKPWAYSYLHRQTGSWGFNKLNAYLGQELAGKMPDPAITFEFPFAHELLNQAAAEGRRQKLKPTPLGIVYNDNINLAAQLWVFLRRITYQGWPVVSAENFRRGGAAEFLRQSGVQKIYFFNPLAYALQDRPRPAAPDGDLLEAELRAKGVVPEEIRNPRNEVAFRVFKFELPQ